jgi:alanine racemase
MDNRTISWAEIDLRAIRSNIAGIKRLISPHTRLMAVVKANAYGHGMVEVAQACLQEGASYLGVATPNEAVTLRKADINSQVLLLGYMPEEYAETMVENRIEVTVFNMDTAQALSQAASISDGEARLHLKIDTGMGRLGFKPDSASLELIWEISRLPGIVLQGIFSHLATADHGDKSFARQQVEIFKRFIEQLEESGVSIPLKHIANSATIMDMPEAHFDMVRSGITTYGLYPSSQVDKEKLDLTPAMRLKSKISYVKTIPEGQSVSYGRTYISEHETRVATVSIGYADGYSRLLSNRGWATIRGRKVPLIGNVCMDQCMFDVSGVENVQIGDEIILFGRPEDGVTADDLADIIGTINYEIVCAPSRRVDRIYIG